MGFEGVLVRDLDLVGCRWSMSVSHCSQSEPNDQPIIWPDSKLLRLGSSICECLLVDLPNLNHAVVQRGL